MVGCVFPLQTYSWGSRKRADITVTVNVPLKTFTPPESDISNLDLEYTDESNVAQSITADVISTDVNIVPPSMQQVTGGTPTPPPGNAASCESFVLLFWLCVCIYFFVVCVTLSLSYFSLHHTLSLHHRHTHTHAHTHASTQSIACSFTRSCIYSLGLGWLVGFRSSCRNGFGRCCLDGCNPFLKRI